MEAEEAQEAPAEPTTLQKLRNMWQFASLMQYIYIFGKTVKIEDEVDIEVLSQHCVRCKREVCADNPIAIGERMSASRAFTEAYRHWPRLVEICFLAQGSHVSALARPSPQRSDANVEPVSIYLMSTPDANTWQRLLNATRLVKTKSLRSLPNSMFSKRFGSSISFPHGHYTTPIVYAKRWTRRKI